MVKDTRVVVGSFNTQNEVETILRDLKIAGYRKEDITLYADQKNIDQLRSSQDIGVKTNEVQKPIEDAEPESEEENHSFWEKIKDLFSSDTEDMYLSDQAGPAEIDILAPFREDIANGNIVVVVNSYHGDVNVGGKTDGSMYETSHSESNIAQTSVREPRDSAGDSTDEKIRLKEERLHVDKEEVQTGEVNVRKEIKHDTETVDVPVEREEVVIERKPVMGADTKTTDTEIEEETEPLTIPVKQEKITVEKEPVVKEEIEIKKKQEQDVETVSEDVKREKLDVDRKGHIDKEDLLK